MEKFLGQEYPAGAQRREFLNSNSDAVEPKGYMKPFSLEQIAQMKDELAETSIAISEVEGDRKAAMDGFKLQLKPLEQAKVKLLTGIKEKAEYVTEDCYKLVDHEGGMVGYYNADGALVESRPLRPEERQQTIFKSLRTGTDN